MDWFEYVFQEQKTLQCLIKNKTDVELSNPVDMYNAATGALVEIGEMLQTDTRWKAYTTGSRKPPIVNKDEFITEWADVFIYMMNVLIYAGYETGDARIAVNEKQTKNYERFNFANSKNRYEPTT